MRLLLDTHVMYWWLRDSPKLGARTKTFIASPQAELMVSFASFWELSVKSQLGKMPESGSALMREAESGNLLLLGLKSGHLDVLEGLEMRPDHKDPFDRVILAQAIAEKATLVTRDAKLLAYDVPRYRVG